MAQPRRTTHLIIAGTNKAGTTALFRYLGDHISVCPSRIKEARFFYKTKSLSRAAYERQFSRHDSTATLFVEASPQYLHGGRTIAQSIQKVLPDAKLLFMLRNPADRVISYFRSSYGQRNVATFGVDFDSFVDIALNAVQNHSDRTRDLDDREKAFRQELRVGHYATFLDQFLQVFGPTQISITFFDNLLTDPHELLREICAFVSIDFDFYDKYTYHVENRTRIHRSVALQDIAGYLNSRFEPILNRFPVIRRLARSTYDTLNVNQNRDIRISAESRKKLEDYFDSWNRDLYTLMLSAYPNKPLPTWLDYEE